MRTWTLALALLLGPGCILVETGPRHHRHHDGCAHDGWGDTDGGGGGAAGAERCRDLEAELEQSIAGAEALAAEESELLAAAQALDLAREAAQDAHADALAAAERARDEALAALAQARAAALDGLLERIALALAEGRYDDAAADTAAYLSAEESLAAQEAQIWADWSAAVAAADQALAEELARVEVEGTALAARLDEITAEVAALQAEQEELRRLVQECWERLRGR